MMMGEGPSHAVIGVQLDAKDSKDGAHVRDVSPGGPAAQAGMRAGDIIVSVNGAEVKGAHPSAEVARLMRRVEPNSKVSIHVLRDGKVVSFEVTARPIENPLDMPGMPPHLGRSFGDFVPGGFAEGVHGSVAGMELVALTPQLGTYFGTEKGILVLRAPRNPAFALEDGDVILAIDGREPTSGSHATRILASYGPGEKVKMQLMRQRKKMTIDATVPERHKGTEPPLASANRAQLSRSCSFPALRCAAIPGTEAALVSPSAGAHPANSEAVAGSYGPSLTSRNAAPSARATSVCQVPRGVS